ncbi:MAG: hypothetical protein KG003_01585 [Bacteroidetes bacterium]|nr:hypothetical protein [Bacteroidota bacterium]
MPSNFRILFVFWMMLWQLPAFAVNVPASNIHVTAKTCRSLDIKWSRGDGQLCMVTCRRASSEIAFPNDGWQYFPDFRFGFGSDLGNENFCIFTGLDSAISIRNLEENTKYVIEIFEFDYNPFVYLWSKAPSLTDSTHWFKSTVNVLVLDSCKKRNQVYFKASATASFNLSGTEWQFPWKSYSGNGITTRMEYSGENSFSYHSLPNLGCSAQIQRDTVYIIPGADSARIITDNAICTGEPEEIHGEIFFGIVPKTAFTRTWIYEDGTQSNILKLYRYHTNPGKYGISLIIRSLLDDKFTGCRDTFYREYTVLKATPLDLGPDTCVSRGGYLKLNSPVAADKYLWDYQGISNKYYVTDTGYHYLTITDNQGCHSTDSIHVDYCAPVSNSTNFLNKEQSYYYTTDGMLHWQNNKESRSEIYIYLTDGRLLQNLSCEAKYNISVSLNQGVYVIRQPGFANQKIIIP